MIEGKLPAEALSRIVLTKRGATRREVLLPPGLGEDSAALDLGGEACVLATDPITAAEEGTGKLAVHICCNDLAACGAEPVGILLTVLLAPGDSEKKLARIMEEVHSTASELGVAILGGHTEVTSAVRRTVLSVTAVGKCPAKDLVRSSGARPGQEVILTKQLALEGTSILASELAEKLKGVLSAQRLERAVSFRDQISIVGEARAASELGASAMHDVTEGGILGALWELAKASEVGLEIWEDEIPILEETRLICQHLGIDPLGLIASGSLLIIAPGQLNLALRLQERGFSATSIGRTVAEAGSYTLVSQDGHRQLVPPRRDELYRAFEN
jgi:hydrogenase expression/formation protein HypE